MPGWTAVVGRWQLVLRTSMIDSRSEKRSSRTKVSRGQRLVLIVCKDKAMNITRIQILGTLSEFESLRQQLNVPGRAGSLIRLAMRFFIACFVVAMGQPSSAQEIFEVIRSCELDQIEQLGENPEEIDEIDSNGLSSLSIAAGLCDGAVVRKVLSMGGDIDFVHPKIGSALHLAAITGELSALEALLAEGANTEARSEDGFTALFHAASRNRVAAVRALIEAGADVNVTDKIGHSVLGTVAYLGHLETVRLLVEAGAETSFRGIDNLTALDYAIDGRHDDVASYLRTVR